MKINGKRVVLASRKYCIDCSPLGARNTAKLELKPDFFPDPERIEGKSNVELQCYHCKCNFIRKFLEVNESGRYFCSRKCSATVTGVGRETNPAKNRTCKRCGAAYKTKYGHTSKLLCVSCADTFKGRSDLYKSMSVIEYQALDSVKGKHPSWRNAHIRSFARSWSKDICQHPCQKCGYSKHVELAHIAPVSSFSENATMGEINDPSNLLALCRNCHWEFDKGLLLLADIPDRNNIPAPG